MLQKVIKYKVKLLALKSNLTTEATAICANLQFAKWQHMTPQLGEAIYWPIVTLMTTKFIEASEDCADLTFLPEGDRPKLTRLQDGLWVCTEAEWCK